MKQLLMTTIAIFGLATITFGQTIPSYVPTDGIVGWWPFNGNTNDESINDNNGTVNGATLTSDRFGNSNAAYNFNGQGNTISFLNTFVFNSNNNGSLSLWFKADGIPNTSYSTILFSKSISGDFNRYNFYIQPPSFPSANTFRLAIDYREDNVSLHSLNDTPLDYFNNGNWYNLIIIRVGSSYDLFINGLFYSTIQDNSSNPPSSIGWIIGGNTIGNLFFMGSIDDIGMWNRALTQEEITSLYYGSALGINEVSNFNLFSVFPNPVQSEINVNTDSKLVGSVFTIYDNLGKAVKTGKINSVNTTIELNDLSGGIYTFSVGENKKQTFKVIKE